MLTPIKTQSLVLTELGAAPPYASGRTLEIRELHLDPPRPHEVQVRIEAAGICHSDLSVVNGSRPRPVPMALGHEAAGVVEQIGVDVTDVRVGDHVVLVFVPSCGSCPECCDGLPALCRVGAVANGNGELLAGGRRLHSGDGTDIYHHLGVSAFSQRAIVDRSSVVVIDHDVPLDIAALFGCALLTGAGAVLNTAQVKPGDSVAVFGLGGVGLAAVMGAVVAGASPVIAVDPLKSKRELALELGASEVYSPEEAVKQIRDRHPSGVRFAIEAVGSERVMRQAFDVTARGGSTVAVGLPHPDRVLSVPASVIVAEARTIIGSYMGSAVPQRDVPLLIDLWRTGRLPVERMRGETVGLDGVPAALDALHEGTSLRQIVTPWGSSEEGH